MYISCKFNEIFYPILKDCIEISDGAYTKEDLLNIEKDILKTINYNVLPPSKEDFYNIIAKAFEFGDKHYYLGKFAYKERNILNKLHSLIVNYVGTIIKILRFHFLSILFLLSNY